MTQLTRHDNLLLPVPSLQARSTGKALLRDLIELAKLRITGMVGATAWLGFLIGERESMQSTGSLAMWSAIVARSGSVDCIRPKPHRAACAMERSVPAPMKIGGCGNCTGTG